MVTPSYPLIVDCSHYQGKLNIPAIQAAGIVGVIAKATEINAFSGAADAYYSSNKVLCEASGLLHGGYAFLDPPAPDGDAQADLFLQTVGLDGNTLVALDLEAAGDTLAEAEAFITRIHDTTGVWPLLYTGAYVIDRIAGHNSQILAKCFLWLADRNLTPFVPPPWDTWTLHQYSYINLGGVTYDLNRYNGSLDGLRMVWKLTSPISGTQDAPLVDAPKIPAFTTAGGSLHSWHNPGEVITAIPSSVQTVNGVDYFETPQDFWLASFNVPAVVANPTPIPIPPTAKTMTTTVALWLRSAASISSATVVLIPVNTQVTLTGTPSTALYHYVSVTVVLAGKTYAGFASADFLK